MCVTSFWQPHAAATAFSPARVRGEQSQDRCEGAVRWFSLFHASHGAAVKCQEGRIQCGEGSGLFEETYGRLAIVILRLLPCLVGFHRVRFSVDRCQRRNSPKTRVKECPKDLLLMTCAASLHLVAWSPQVGSGIDLCGLVALLAARCYLCHEHHDAAVAGPPS